MLRQTTWLFLLLICLSVPALARDVIVVDRNTDRDPPTGQGSEFEFTQPDPCAHISGVAQCEDFCQCIGCPEWGPMKCEYSWGDPLEDEAGTGHGGGGVITHIENCVTFCQNECQNADKLAPCMKLHGFEKAPDGKHRCGFIVFP